MPHGWMEVGRIDLRDVVDGRMPGREFSARITDFGAWVAVHAEPYWYVGSRAEFVNVFLPAIRPFIEADGGPAVGELLRKFGARDVPYVGGLTVADLLGGSALDRLDDLCGAAIGKDDSGVLGFWTRQGQGSVPALFEGPIDHFPMRTTEHDAGLLFVDRDVDEGADAGSWNEKWAERMLADDIAEHAYVGAESPGVLAAEAAAPPFPELDLAEEPEGGRWINAVLEDHDVGEPLVIQNSYVLAISIDLDESTAPGAVGTAQASKLTRDPDVEIKLTVTLTSADFDISDAERPLRVAKTGLSIGKARFDIQPTIASGPGRLTAIIHHENNFVQQLDIVLEVGERTPEGTVVTSVGRPVGVAQNLSRRDIGLSIQPSPLGGYECMTWGAVASFAHLPISADELAQGIENLRRALIGVVMAKDANGRSPFQQAIAIDPAVSAAGLKVIAKAGYLLFRSLFFHPAADAQCQNLGTYLIDEVTKADEGFTLQVLAREFPVPWSLIYITDAWDEHAVQWNGFLGAKLIVEQIPLCNDANRRDTRMPGIPDGLAVSLNFNSDIDTDFTGGLVASQQAYWQSVTTASPKITSKTRTRKADLISSLKDGALSDQIIYFYCHAQSLGLGAGGGPGQSRLIMSGQEQVTLEDLNLGAPAKQKLRGAPLVFINACESGELSPLFYNGFVPYFLSKGARGVIGTECKVPALFASEWAKRFFDEFLGGSPLGETVRKLRNEFFSLSGNPLGLLYGVHCNADTQIHPLP